MPRKIKKSKRKNLYGVEDWQRALLAFGPAGVEAMHPAKKFALIINRHEKWAEWWAVCREELLADWGSMFPETMPWAWWEFEAPRWSDPRFLAWSGRLPAPRIKLSGSGAYRHDRLAYVPAHTAGQYQLVDINETDPPVFESEVSYLRRHGIRRTSPPE